MRTTRQSNEVFTLVLGKESSRQLIACDEELSAYSSQFFESIFCWGVPPIPQSEAVRTLKYGQRNILNWWQSTHCTIKIMDKAVSTCGKCNFLGRAVVSKLARYVTCCNLN